MNEGLSKFLEWFEKGWDWIAPFFICFPYEGGVVLRWGNYNRDVRPGLNWKWPCAEYVVDCNVVEDIDKVEKQNLTTKDLVQIELSTVVRFKIVDPRKFLLDLQDQKAGLHGVTEGATRRVVESKTFQELVETSWETEVADRLRRRVEKYGIQILEVTYGDLGKKSETYVNLRVNECESLKRFLTL